MADTHSPLFSPHSPHPQQGQHAGRHSRGRGRGGRGSGTGSHNAARDDPVASPLPSTHDPSGPPAQPQTHRHGRGRFHNARGPHRGGSAQRGQPRHPPIHRSFGANITTASDDNTTQPTPGFLSANAPEFVPGQPIVTRRHGSTAHGRPKQAQTKPPKSQADDLSTRIHEDISHANYECAICTDEVLRNSQVWSCTLCWTVVHMKCVNKWHENQKRQHAQTPEPVRDFFWRCPGCNSKLSEDPGPYHCWCGKDVGPRPAPSSLPPHSCGQTCAKPRSTCPHSCPLQCHAGPCPPCDLMGPEQSCFCGKHSSRKLCRDTNYEDGWGCAEVCDDFLPCGVHNCQKPCHPGLCGDCTVVVEARCYCGKEQKNMPCCEQDDAMTSFDVIQGTEAEGTFHCARECQRTFDCGIHKCLRDCHPQDEKPAHCPSTPDVVSDCPCGKTSLSELLPTPRATCEDPIPHCDKPCGKVLRCGHACKKECHTGECGFCDRTIEIACRCGRTQTPSMCHQGDVSHPVCFRTCQATLSCGRHKCGDRCCAGEKKAAERQAAKKKHRLPSQTQAVEAEHICIKTCGRLLKCGSHHCQQICHRGPCGTCPEAIFSEVSCDCGRTVLQPPQPCGTRPPDCRFPCRRRPACGHPAIDHTCHSDDVNCPKCPFLVQKRCICGKEKLHSQPCHLQEPRCGRACGEQLKCGLHNCRKLCHQPGHCEDEGIEGQHCTQACGKKKSFCAHLCQHECHGKTPCNESTPCIAKATITCPCGQHRQEVKCNASSSNPTPSHPELKCDDECLRLERNRRLAAALNIDPSTHSNDHVPYSDATLSLYKDSPSWCETQEREFRVFSQSPQELRLRYKPMPSSQRQFLHCLAQDFGLDSQSEDTEPWRYIVVFKGSRFVSAPGKTVSQCIKIRERQAAEAAAAAAASSRPPSPPVGISVQPWNAYLVLAPRFGLTVEDVHACFDAEWSLVTGLHFTITFLPTDQILLRATTDYSASLSPTALAQTLALLKPKLLTLTKGASLAENIILCRAEEGDEITRRENSTQQDASGWSAVAGRAAAKPETKAFTRDAPTPPTTTRKLLGLKKKKQPPAEPSKEERPWGTLGGDVEC